MSNMKDFLLLKFLRTQQPIATPHLLALEADRLRIKRQRGDLGKATDDLCRV